MIRRTGIYIGCLAISYIAISFQLSKDTSATLMTYALTVVIGTAIYSAISGFFHKQLLPDLHKKAIFITGCDSGFGHLLAQRLDALGVTVYAGCLLPKGSGAMELKEKSSVNLHIVELDVRNDSHVEASVEYVRKTLQGKDLWAVINNAGIATFGEMEWHSTETLQNIMDVNFFGHIRTVKAFLPLLRESKGRIVNVLSEASYFVFPWMVPYSCSKFAARAFLEGLRIELRKFSISVHGIAPWFYMTPILKIMESSDVWDSCPKSVQDAYGEDYPMRGLERLKWLLLKLGRPSSHLGSVVDCMVDACLGSIPKDVYVPSLWDKLTFIFLSYGPRFLIDNVLLRSQPPPTTRKNFSATPSRFSMLWHTLKSKN